jgi:hypothetical protein
MDEKSANYDPNDLLIECDFREGEELIFNLVTS